MSIRLSILLAPTPCLYPMPRADPPYEPYGLSSVSHTVSIVGTPKYNIPPMFIYPPVPFFATSRLASSDLEGVCTAHIFKMSVRLLVSSVLTGEPAPTPPRAPTGFWTVHRDSRFRFSSLVPLSAMLRLCDDDISVDSVS